MKNLVLTIILALFFSSIAAQTCLPGGITFTTQQQIDDFVMDYPGCTEIEGNVRINDSVSGNITNLNGLSQLDSIGGFLDIDSNSSLTSMIGLEDLESIGGYLYIGFNGTLTSMIGFESLSFIGSYLYIDSNISLVNMIGLESLSTLGGNLVISENESLTSLTGMDSLTSIGGNLNILINESLTSLVGIQNINPYDISSGNNNPDLRIQYNPLLFDCEVQSICNFLFIPEIITAINNNGIGCNTQTEIENACQMLPVFDTYLDSRDNNLTNIFSKINLYPNPTTNKFTLDFSDTDINNVNITILDLSGAIQFRNKKSINENSISINLETLNPGLYLVKIYSEEYGILYKKLMLQK